MSELPAVVEEGNLALPSVTSTHPLGVIASRPRKRRRSVVEDSDEEGDEEETHHQKSDVDRVAEDSAAADDDDDALRSTSDFVQDAYVANLSSLAPSAPADAGSSGAAQLPGAVVGGASPSAESGSDLSDFIASDSEGSASVWSSSSEEASWTSSDTGSAGDIREVGDASEESEESEEGEEGDVGEEGDAESDDNNGVAESEKSDGHGEMPRAKDEGEIQAQCEGREGEAHV